MKQCPKCGRQIDKKLKFCKFCSCDLAHEYNKLGLAHEQKQNFSKAFEYFCLSADIGDVCGLEKVARCFEDGIGTDKNPQKALDCWIKAGNKGSAYAQYKAGWTYHHEKQDFALAVEWYKRGVTGGNKQAKKGLCDLAFYMLMYPRQGHEMQDEKLGFELMIFVADSGETEAYSHLGFCYQRGKGTNVDLQKAKYWFAKAVDAGESYFKQYVDEITKQLEDKQV